MKRLYRRERHQLIFAGFAASAGVVALLFFVILYLPLRAQYRASNEAVERLGAESRIREAQLARLEAAVEDLSAALGQRTRFLGGRLISRDDGFAAMIPDLERLAEISGIARNRTVYDTSEQVLFGLHAVTINMPVRSSYESLTRWIQELEDSDTFFILDSIQIRRTQAELAGDLDLSLNLTTFFRQEP